MKTLLFTLILSQFFVSCGKDCPCFKQDIIPYFVSYTDNESDSIIIRRFQRGSNFTQLIDTFRWTPFNSSRIRQSDTVQLFPNRLEERLNDGYDWQVINESDQKFLFISDIQLELREGRCGGIFGMDPQPCTSPVISYKRNNVTVIPNPSDPSTFPVIKK